MSEAIEGAGGAAAALTSDAVDFYISQWAKERPGMDVSPMAIIGRVSRLAVELQNRLDRVFADFGLQSWEFDVMATLVRSGQPYELTPGELDRTMMITSGTTTHRIAKLEQRGFVTRRRDEHDKRVVRVQLTDAGLAVFDEAHVAHMDNEHRILAPLSEDDATKLVTSLKVLTRAVSGACDRA